MIPEFENLNQDEQGIMYGAPILVAILIAGADGKIDKSEMREAIAVSSMKKVKARKDLKAYYEEVGTDFEDKLKFGIRKFPNDSRARQLKIVEELEKINDIMPKIERRFAIKFVESIKDFAKRVAEASGGVLGYMSVGYEESKLIDLKMIKNPG